MEVAAAAAAAAAALALHVFLQSTVEAQAGKYYLMVWAEPDGGAEVAYAHKQPFPWADCMRSETVTVVAVGYEMR